MTDFKPERLRLVRELHARTVKSVLMYREDLQRPGVTLWERDRCRRYEGLVRGIEKVIDILELPIELPERGSFTMTS
jgi:hypothetical protein